MERRNKEKILEMIKDIEKKNLEIENVISTFSIPTRNEMLKNISQDIIKNNPLLQELLGTEERVVISEKKGEISPEKIIDGYISKIQQNAHKKVIFLREFLDLFQDRISEMDKNVILKSLKEQKNDEKLRDEMLSLANIFKLNL